VFKKKKTAKTSRRIYIPEEHMKTVAELATINDKEDTKISLHLLWSYIASFIPEIKCGKWTLHCGNAIQYCVEEQL
jgi:hypothetical protein